MKLVKSSSSILRKFLLFNFFAFLFLGSLTFFYLSGIQPNLVKQRMEKHTIIINNTSNHLERLSIEFSKESLKNFLLSTRFLFQNLERVQFYNITGDLIADTNVLDLDQSVFTKTEVVMEEEIKDNDAKKLSDENTLKNNFNVGTNNNLKEIIRRKTMSEIQDDVKKIVVDHLGIDESKVVPEAKFIDDLGADSLDTVELVMAFEEKFGIEIPDDAAETIQTVQNAIDYIQSKK